MLTLLERRSQKNAIESILFCGFLKINRDNDVSSNFLLRESEIKIQASFWTNNMLIGLPLGDGTKNRRVLSDRLIQQIYQ